MKANATYGSGEVGVAGSAGDLALVLVAGLGLDAALLAEHPARSRSRQKGNWEIAGELIRRGAITGKEMVCCTAQPGRSTPCRAPCTQAQPRGRDRGGIGDISCELIRSVQKRQRSNGGVRPAKVRVAPAVSEESRHSFRDIPRNAREKQESTREPSVPAKSRNTVQDSRQGKNHTRWSGLAPVCSSNRTRRRQR